MIPAGPTFQLISEETCQIWCWRFGRWQILYFCSSGWSPPCTQSPGASCHTWTPCPQCPRSVTHISPSSWHRQNQNWTVCQSQPQQGNSGRVTPPVNDSQVWSRASQGNIVMIIGSYYYDQTVEYGGMGNWSWLHWPHRRKIQMPK